MTLRSIALISCLLLGSVIVESFPRSAEKPPLELPNLRAICSYDTGRVVCWDPKGTRVRGIEAIVDRALRSRGEYGLTYRFGMKNRVLVVSQKDGQQISFSAPGSRYLNGFDAKGDDFNSNLKLIPVSTAPENSRGSLTALLQSEEQLGQVTTPAREGAGFRLEDTRVTLGAPIATSFEDRTSKSADGSVPYRKSWSVPLQIVTAPHTDLEFQVEAFDLDGKPIVNADLEGRPIPNGSAGSIDYQQNWVKPVNTNSRGFGESKNLQSFVNPSNIREIRWTVSRSRQILFPDFALDPKR